MAAVVFKSLNYTGSSKVLVCAKVVLSTSYVLGSVGGSLFTKLLLYMMVKVGAGRALRQLTRLYVSYTTALVLFIPERTDNITRVHVDALVNDRVFVFND